jgi:hypothetical protein
MGEGYRNLTCKSGSSGARRGGTALRYPVLREQQLDHEIETVLKALRPTPILKAFFLSWVTLGAFIGFGSVWASAETLSTFHPSAAWILTVVLGSALSAAGPVMIRIWGLRRYLTRTNEELREQLEKDWSVLTRRGWFGRLTRFSLAASAVAGISIGTLLSILFPEDRFLGGTVATIGAMTSMFLVPILPMVFGARALLVRQITRRAEGSLAPEDTEWPNGV